MSRIHEALKKAEEERVAQAAPASAVASVSAAEVPVPARVAASNSASSDAAASRPAPSPVATEPSPLNGALTAEFLQERCVRTNWNPDPTALLSFNGGQPTVGTEEFRTLRSRLYQFRTTQPLKTVLVTSALAGEGKTFISSNMAQTLAQHRARRVLLIDADMRKPRLHEVLGTRSTPGIAEYLCGEKDELAVLQRPADNLFFIPGGNTVSNAAELIANGQFSRLLERVAAAFDWIIIDSPPWVLVSDASVIADACDGVLLVVQAASTPVEVAQQVRQQLRTKRFLGVALNRVNHSAGYSSYYYYSTYGAHAAKE